MLHVPTKAIRVPVPPPRPAHLDPVQPQTRVGDYEVVRWLGAGTFGAVYLARQIDAGALAMPPQPIVLKICTLRGAENEERFLREPPILQKLDNPHIVKVHSVGSVAGIGRYIAMEWGGDRTLQQELAMAPGARLPWLRVLRIADQIADALHELGRSGVVHQDLKPENILLSDRAGADWIKVIDFGVAQFVRTPDVGASPAASEGFMGTPEYASPEQARGLAVDPRSDLYAFGVILYQMLAGKFPFAERGQSALTARLGRPPDPISAHLSDLPDAVWEILRRCLEVDVDRRFQTAAEIRQAIQAVEAPGTSQAQSSARAVVAAGLSGGRS